MSKSARSIFVFSIYLFALGAILIFIPNVLLGFFRMPESDEVWIRVVGMLASILGFYYFRAAKSEFKVFFQATVYGRSAVLLFFIGFVAAGMAPPVLILFGFIDALAALWTQMSLRSEMKS